MTAQTFTAASASANRPLPTYAGAGVVLATTGSFTLTEVPEVNDIVELCRLPKGAQVIGGTFWATDIDTGTETVDIDVGYAANGVDSVDADFFVNGGVFTGDAGDWTPNTRPVAPKSFLTFGAETVVTATFNAVAHGGGTGSIYVTLLYIMPGAAS